MAPVCRPKVLVPLLAAVTATAFALAAARVSLAGDTAVFTTLRFEHQGLQEFFGAFDFTVPVILGGVLLLSGGCLALRKWCEGAAALLILPATALAVSLPKVLIDRPWPEGDP